MVNDFKQPKKLIDKNSIFVILRDGLRFLSERATATLKSYFVAEPAFSLAAA